ncbi:MAG: DUF58 domain-containing protein [Parvularcula sp.]
MTNPQNRRQLSHRDLENTASEVAETLPALLVEAERLAATLATGVHGRLRAGAGETFWQYRDYTINDPATAIDWRQSARSPSRLYVRETEWETAASVRFWCGGQDGFSFASNGNPTKQWRAWVLATAAAYSLARAGEKIGALPPDGPTRNGLGGVTHLAEALIRHPLTKTLPPPDRSATHTVYLSDFYFPTEPLIDRIRSFAETGVACHFVEVTDPAETHFPYSGHVRFQSPSRNAPPRRFGQAEQIRQAYTERRDAHREALKNVCRQVGFSYIAHTTEHPAGTAFAALHGALSGAGRV